MKTTPTLRVVVFLAAVAVVVSCGGAPSREQDLQATVSTLQTQVAGQAPASATSAQAAAGTASPQPSAPPATVLASTPPGDNSPEGVVKVLMTALEQHDEQQYRAIFDPAFRDNPNYSFAKTLAGVLDIALGIKESNAATTITFRDLAFDTKENDPTTALVSVTGKIQSVAPNLEKDFRLEIPVRQINGTWFLSDNPASSLAPTAAPQGPAIVLAPLEITRQPSTSKGAGWSDVTIQFAAENQGGKPFFGYWPDEVTLNVQEGFTYPLRRQTASYANAEMVIAPGFRVLAPRYIATIGETTHPTFAAFNKTAPDRTLVIATLNVEKPVGHLTFPTDMPASELTPLPDVIEMPGESRLTVEGFGPKKSMNVASGGVFAGGTHDAVLMNITLENLNAGQDLKLSLIIGIYDNKGTALRDGVYSIDKDGRCYPAGMTAIFTAGPGQKVQQQLCIPEGQTTPFGDKLSLDGLKLMVWVHPSVYGIYGNPTNNETWHMYDVAATQGAGGQAGAATAPAAGTVPTAVPAPSAGNGTIEIPLPGAQATLPLHILARVGRPGEQVAAALRWQDGTELTQPLTTLRGEDGRGLLITNLAWTSEGKPPQPGTQPATLELRDSAGAVLATQHLTMLGADDPNTTTITLYWVVGLQLQPIQRRIPKTARVGTAALQELLWGPEPKNLAGFSTALPTPDDVLKYPGRGPDWGPRVVLRSLTITDGVATADFSKELKAYASGSERVRLIREQITQTLKQFPTVREVRIAIEGQTEGVLEA